VLSSCPASQRVGTVIKKKRIPAGFSSAPPALRSGKRSSLTFLGYAPPEGKKGGQGGNVQRERWLFSLLCRLAVKKGYCCKKSF